MADSQAKSNRGFAAMDEDRQREIASEGGRAAHESGNAHEFDSEEARAAVKRSAATANTWPTSVVRAASTNRTRSGGGPTRFACLLN